MQLHYKKYGEGESAHARPVLIILHGLFGSLTNWNTVANRLADRFTVYALDQRNTAYRRIAIVSIIQPWPRIWGNSCSNEAVLRPACSAIPWAAKWRWNLR